MTDEFNSVVFLSDYINLLIFSLPQLIFFDYTQIKNLGNDEAITMSNDFTDILKLSHENIAIFTLSTCINVKLSFFLLQNFKVL